mgnify:CR=1 FL=1
MSGHQMGGDVTQLQIAANREYADVRNKYYGGASGVTCACDEIVSGRERLRPFVEHVTIAADQVSHGNPFFGAEVRLEDGDKLVGRYVVSVGATPLKD